MSGTEEDARTLESSVQVAPADLSVGLPTFGAQRAKGFLFIYFLFSQDIMLSSSIFFMSPDDFLCSVGSVEELLFQTPLLHFS